ncbi:MAG: NAD-dependent deacylase [Phycisphaerae bacterium]|nr:MAG: NAD-dependent deacylase [Phycisphaerae bacterium]
MLLIWGTSVKVSCYNVVMADNLAQMLERLANELRKASRVLCLTGAGVSAESGVPTFRDADGLWEGARPEDLATPEAFERDSAFVWRFYQSRRQKLLSVLPNPAHEVIARFESRFPEFNLVTQNVDGLHQLAGSKRILCLHGDIWIDRCTVCGFESRVTEAVDPMPKCATCGELARPGVVWFGEMLPAGVFERAVEYATEAEVVLVVGTSSQVYPAASLAEIAKQSDAFVAEINPNATSFSGSADLVIPHKAGKVCPELEMRLPETAQK